MAKVKTSAKKLARTNSAAGNISLEDAERTVHSDGAASSVTLRYTRGSVGLPRKAISRQTRATNADKRLRTKTSKSASSAEPTSARKKRVQLSSAATDHKDKGTLPRSGDTTTCVQSSTEMSEQRKDPTHVGRIDCDINGWRKNVNRIVGLAILDDCIYVLIQRVDRVSVFANFQPFEHLYDIDINAQCSRLNPQDLVAYKEAGKLFIADIAQNAIWRIGKQNEQFLLEKFIDVGQPPATLSLRDRRLVVAVNHDFNARPVSRVYHADTGDPIQTIRLPEGIAPRHILETPSSTFLIVGNETREGSICHSVMEVDRDGCVIHLIESPDSDNHRALYCPRYLALLPDGRVLVANCFNDSVILLDQQLQLDAILVRSTNSRPRPVVYDSQRHHLIVGGEWNKQVDIYKWE